MDAFLENLTSCKNHTLEITGLMVENTTGAEPLKPVSLCNQSTKQRKEGQTPGENDLGQPRQAARPWLQLPQGISNPHRTAEWGGWPADTARVGVRGSLVSWTQRGTPSRSPESYKAEGALPVEGALGAGAHFLFS